MKVKKIMIVLGLMLGLITLMSSECNNSDPVDPDCNGIVTATATGNVSGSFCFNKLSNYSFVVNESVNLSVSINDDSQYSCFVSVSPFNGAGTYNCGPDEPGYVELVQHGDGGDFYKSQSGTLTVTQVDDTHFVATFNVVTVGYYNEQTVNYSGSVNKN